MKTVNLSVILINITTKVSKMEFLFCIKSYERRDIFQFYLVCKTSGLQCLNGGDCINRGGRAVCSCPPEFSGETCEKTRGIFDLI